MHDPPRWRIRRRNERLLARECSRCGFVDFPEEKSSCKRCRTPDVDWTNVPLAEEGTVQSYVVQKRLPEKFETPLPLAIVDMPQVDGGGEPARVYGLFTETEPDAMEIGMRAVADFRTVFELEGLPVHSYKFKLPREARR
jgi:uncharacterized OB-fold protein